MHGGSQCSEELKTQKVYLTYSESIPGGKSLRLGAMGNARMILKLQDLCSRDLQPCRGMDVAGILGTIIQSRRAKCQRERFKP